MVAALRWNRARGMEQLADLLTLRDRYASGFIDAGTVKIMQDGVMENYTAAMLEPYLVPSGTRGIPMIDLKLLKDIVTRLDLEGFQVHFHAIGDAAIRQSLDTLEAFTLNAAFVNRLEHDTGSLQVGKLADL